MGRIGIKRRPGRGLRHLAYGIAASILTAVLALLAAAVLVDDLATASDETPRLVALRRWVFTTVALAAAGWGAIVVLLRRGARGDERAA